MRGLLRGFGLKVGEISKGQFAARVRTLVAGHTMLERIAQAMLQAREALKVEFRKLHRAMLVIVRGDAVLAGGGRRRRGVCALVALTFTSGVDAPERCPRSKGVGAHFGLTPRKHQSGETDVTGAVSRVGDVMVRTALYEAAHILLTRAVRFSALKRWALEVAKRRGWGGRKWRWRASLRLFSTACGWMARPFAGAGRPRRRRAGGRNVRSHAA